MRALVILAGEGENDHIEISWQILSVPLNKACSQKRNCFIQLIGPNLLGFYHNLINLGKEILIPPTLDILFHQRGEKTENHICTTTQGHRLTNSPSPSHRSTECLLLPPTPYPHNTKGLFTSVPFIQYIMAGFQPIFFKLQGMLRGKKHSLNGQSIHKNQIQIWQES